MSSLPSLEGLYSVGEAPVGGGARGLAYGWGRGYTVSSHIQPLQDLLELHNRLPVIDVVKVITEAQRHYHLPKVGPCPCLEHIQNG